MDSGTLPTSSDRNSAYEAMIRSWERKTPLIRRILARMGLQAKLIISFLFLLVVALGGSYWVLVGGTSDIVRHLMGEHAIEISQTLAMASETPIVDRDVNELTRIGKDLLKSRNIVKVVFFDAAGHPLAVASQDADYDASAERVSDDGTTRGLMQVRRINDPSLGTFSEVTAPVFRYPNPARIGQDPSAATMRLVGYVSVGVTEGKQQAYLTRVYVLLMILGAVVTMISIPLVYLLVYRIFWPIRQLVQATDRIAQGDLDARVAIHRPDMIGTLARSFNEMVKRVKRQQDDLEEANEKLAAANHDLEDRIAQRTCQLEAANRRLSAEIAEKEDFLRAVSHDLNAPLRNISGMATMLLMKHRDKFDDDIIHRLERIQKNVEIETDLIGELLELSRIKTRRQKMEMTDIHAMVSDLAGLFEDDLRKNSIEFVISGRLPVLNCERARMRQVFQNLVDNAIKYMGEGSEVDGVPNTRRIEIGCTVRPQEAEFYVRDTGIGIEPEDAAKVFHVFRRGKHSAVQAVSGKGVGLASVKSIIETYNGSIWVESQVGRGSTFRFTINGQYVPAAAGAIASPRSSNQPETQREASPA